MCSAARRERLAPDPQHGEPVVALRADGLQSHSLETWLPGDEFEHPANTLDSRVVAGIVDDGAMANHVVDDDDRARPRQPQCPGNVFGDSSAVGSLLCSRIPSDTRRTAELARLSAVRTSVVATAAGNYNVDDLGLLNGGRGRSWHRRADVDDLRSQGGS